MQVGTLLEVGIKVNQKEHHDFGARDKTHPDRSPLKGFRGVVKTRGVSTSLNKGLALPEGWKGRWASCQHPTTQRAAHRRPVRVEGAAAGTPRTVPFDGSIKYEPLSQGSTKQYGGRNPASKPWIMLIPL